MCDSSFSSNEPIVFLTLILFYQILVSPSPKLTDMHFHAFIASLAYVYKIMEHAGVAWLKLRDFAGHVINTSIVWIKTDVAFLDQYIFLRTKNWQNTNPLILMFLSNQNRPVLTDSGLLNKQESIPLFKYFLYDSTLHDDHSVEGSPLKGKFQCH